MSTHHYVAADLGAGSGRVMLGTLEEGIISLEDVHRFDSGGLLMGGSRRWNIAGTYGEILTGLRKIFQRGIVPEGVSCDSWGVDYVLLRGEEPMLGLPFMYRDSRNDDAFERTFPVVPKEEIFSATGIQLMNFNTIFQLHADKVLRPDILEVADGFLLIGDYINYLLSGRRAAEESLASTTQLYNPEARQWARGIIEKLELPGEIFPEIVPSGTVLGDLEKDLATELKAPDDVKVIATCSHDTGAAVAAVPAEGDDWAYLSSGTWSLLGAELPSPIINENARAANFTNEVGFGGSIRFLKNITGLWIIQECRRHWAGEGKEYSFAEMAAMATEAEPLTCLVHPDWEEFAKPGDMPAKIIRYCELTKQPVPTTPGAMLRAVQESLASHYMETLQKLDALTGRTTKRLHIIGGGSQNDLLNQLTANATGLPVYAGPVEATAIGNMLVQAIALGHVSSHDDARRIVQGSFAVKEITPQDADTWAATVQRFAGLPIKP